MCNSGVNEWAFTIIMESLSVVDFSSPDRKETASRIVHVMETVGFLYLDNVPGYNIRRSRGRTNGGKQMVLFSTSREERQDTFTIIRTGTFIVAISV